MEPFRADGPLPRGITLLEASAGTGKTHTIAGLVARYVAEGTPLDRLLVVTFTRMATGELRDRVRARLREAEGVLAGLRDPGGDAALVAIAGGPEAGRAERLERIRTALGGFDAATITTIHGFCGQMLTALGIAGDGLERAEPVEDTADLQTQVVDDLYLRAFRGTPAPPFTRDRALDAVREAVANPLAPVVPEEHPLARFAGAARDELARRMRRLGLITHDDLLLRLHAALSHPARGPAARARLRARFDVTLIDEFQDTDPVQWDIVRAAFGGSTLVLIGDPKQAIYGFRGADVHAYLEAGAHAGHRATLDVNWRTDQALLDALDAVFAGRELGHPDIPFRTVRSARPGTGCGLVGDDPRPPLRVRIARRDRGRFGLTQKGYAQVATVRAHVTADVAAEAARLLASGAGVRRDEAERPLAPGDIAVLVRTNAQATGVRDALEAAGVPAVIAGAGSVFATAAAADWLALLRGIERPADPALASAAALTDLIGWDAAALARAGDDDRERLHRRLHELGDTLRHAGVAAVLERLAAEDGLTARILARTDGERAMTDLRHVAQLLHGAAQRDRLGAPALAAWLAERIARVRSEGGDERSRRLESDAAAVQVLTVHRSKGLEFPVVLCPFLWDATEPREDELRVFHDAAHGGRRVVDVGGKDADGAEDRIAQHDAEVRGEDLRLAYVALTRARHAAVVWWAASWGSRRSALHALLFPDERTPPADDAAAAAITALAPADLVGVESTDGDGAAWTPRRDAPDRLEAARWERTLDRAWRRTSFSAIIAGAHEPVVASEPERGAVADEPPAPAAAAAPAVADPLPLAGAPAGTGFGSLVHEVLEGTDFTAPDLAGDLATALAARAPAWGVTLPDPAAVAAGLVAALETPLPPGIRLRDLPHTDRLDELAFELPLVGGDRPTGDLRTAAIAALLERHLPGGDPVRAYAARLREPGVAQVLRGHLTGALDLVARLPDGRFAVLDYKTNHLGPRPEDYGPAALAAAMAAAHYPLQALLYLVCLHRYLRWRVRDYAPERHLAGAGYLFLRGMTPDAGTGGTGPGVFWWEPPAGMVAELSDLLDAGVTP